MLRQKSMGAVVGGFGLVMDTIDPGKRMIGLFINIGFDLRVGQKSAAVFLATNDNTLNEAVLLRQEARLENCKNFIIVAMIETMEMQGLRKS